MKLKDELLEDKEKIKSLPDRKSKMQFIWDYYKIPIIVVAFFLSVFLITQIASVGKGNYNMYVCLINNDSIALPTDDTVFATLLEKGGVKMGDKEVNVIADMTLGLTDREEQDIEVLQILSGMFAVDDLDLYFCDERYFEYFAVNGGFKNLSEVIDEELLKKVENDLYYVSDSNGNKVAVGIILHSGSPIHQAGFYHNDVIMGIVANANYLDNAKAFTQQLIKELNY